MEIGLFLALLNFILNTSYRNKILTKLNFTLLDNAIFLFNYSNRLPY